MLYSKYLLLMLRATILHLKEVFFLYNSNHPCDNSAKIGALSLLMIKKILKHRTKK